MTDETAPAPVSLPARLKRGWDRFFFAEEAAYAQVGYRVFFAVWTLLFWAPRFPHAWELYCRPVLRYVHKVVKWSNHPLPPEWLVRSAFVVLLAGLVGFALSRRPRIFHLIIMAPMSFLYALDTMMPRAYGALAFVLWWLLFLMPYDSLYDDEGRVRRVPVVAKRLIQIQWASVYLYTVPAKLYGGRGWDDGSVLYWTFHGTRYGDWLLSHWIDIPMWACLFGVWFTMACELFSALGIWFRPTRRFAMLTVVLLHTMMTLTLRVSLLFPLLMIGHLLLFLTEDEWRKIHAWWWRVRGKGELPPLAPRSDQAPSAASTEVEA